MTRSQRIFAKFFAGQLFIMLVALSLIGLSFKKAALVIAAFTVSSWWMALVLFVPLRRLMAKAQRAGESEPIEEDLETDDDFGEIESALNRMRTDLRDKTEALFQEREELSILMAAISDAIVAVNQSGLPLFYNSKFALLFGGKEINSQVPRLGELFRQPEVLNAFHHALKEGKPYDISTLLHVNSDTAPRYFALSVAPLRKKKGENYGAVGIFHDVTDLKLAEKIRIDFVANVSHELRTPLTSIKGYADTLQQDFAQKRYEGADQFIQIIARNVDRLMSLIEDLLELSLLDSSDSKGDSSIWNKTQIETRPVSERVIAQLAPKWKSRGHQVVLDCQVDQVYADANRVEQVLTNLIDNAIKYMTLPGKVTIMWNAGKNAVRLHVVDTGPGIDAVHLPRLFERFYRVDQARSQEVSGTGLGLAIVKHIMQRHGGTAWVLSEPGKGAEFVCQFPNP